MSIIQETATIRKHTFYHTYSNLGYTVKDTNGHEYSEAYDVMAKTYTETGNLRHDATDGQKAADAAKKAAASEAATATAETTAASGTSYT